MFEEKTRLLLTLATLAGFWGAGTEGVASEQSSGKAFADYLKTSGYEAVPAKRLEQNKLVLEAKIGNDRRSLLLDTGCGLTTLDPQAARGLKKLSELGGALEDGKFGTRTDPSLVIMEKLALGRAQFMNQPARVLSLDADYVTSPWIGVLGCDFYERNFCLIDCLSGTLYVRGSKPSRDVAEKIAETFRRSGFTEVPADSDQALVIRIQVNGHTARLLVDTGSYTTLLDQEQSKSFGLLPYKEKGTSTLIPRSYTARAIGIGAVGSHEIRVAKIKDLELGSMKLDNIYVGVCSLDAWAKPDQRDWIGVIGQDLLESLGGVLDFSEGKVWLRRTKKP